MKRTFSSSITVDAPPEKVWELLSDPAVYPELVEFTDRIVEMPEGEFGVGSTWKEYGGIKPFMGEATWTVTVHEPMTRQVHEGTDTAMHHELAITLTPTEGGTRIDATTNMTPKWWAVPVSLVTWPLMLRKKGQAMFDSTLANVKARVESSG